MAELLVHEHVPFAAIMGLAVRTEAMATRVEALLQGLGAPPPVRVRPEWYF
jgi:hypothetical protein